MNNQVVTSALSRLRADADAVGKGWAPSQWRILDEHKVERNFDRAFTPGAISWIVGGIGELELVPGSQMSLRTTLTPPANLHGVDLLGDRLEVTVKSLYPIEIALDDEVILSESIPPVAAGPALLEVAESIQPDSNQQLEITIRPLEGQRGGGVTWLDLVFTTPGLRRRFDALDLAWARLYLADSVAKTPAQRATVDAAARLVPESPLGLTEDELAIELERVADALQALSSEVAALEVHVVGHAHIDLAWLWTWNDTREVIKRDVRTVLSIMDDYPEATFTHSQPAGYEVIRAEEPQLFQDLLQKIAEGRWEPATAQWVEGDTNLASGEAMASQLLEGVSFSREHLGVSPRVFLAPDTFGHSANMPQLVSSTGADIYYHMRCNPGAAKGRMWPAYWWEGVDGTRIFTCSTSSYNGHLTAGSIARAAVDGLHSGLDVSLLFIGVGDHGGGPTRQGYDTLRAVGTASGMPRAHCSTIAQYADDVLASGAQLPVHRGESAKIFEGCYTTHAAVKKGNRDAENRLVTAESLAALAGLKRSEQLDDAWRRLCFNQFHDIVTGSAIPDVYDMTMDDYASVCHTADEVIERALDVLTSAEDSASIMVLNPHSHECTDIVAVPADQRDAPTVLDELGRIVASQVSGGQLRFVATVPSFGLARFHIGSATSGEIASARNSSEDLEVTTVLTGTEPDSDYLSVQTQHFRAVIRRNCGIITSLVDRRTGSELVAYGMRRPTDYGDPARADLGLNVFQLIDEKPHFMSAWQYQEVHAEYSLIDGATTQLVETGPVRTVVRVEHEVRSSRITQDIIFYHALAKIDFEVHVDWQERGGHDVGIPNLKLAFTPDIDVTESWFEVPNAAVRRRSNGQQVPALRWADIGTSDYGVALLNDSTYAHDVLGSRLRVHLLRTAYMPDPRSDEGLHTFRFSLMPHVGGWREAALPSSASLFNQPLLTRVATNTSPDAPSKGAAWKPSIEQVHGSIRTVLRTARDGRGTVVRLVETSGIASSAILTGFPEGSVVWASDVTERKSLPLRSAGPSLNVRLRPWEVRTIVVEPDDVEKHYPAS